jgi:hypothetical protein
MGTATVRVGSFALVKGATGGGNFP